MKFVFYNDFKPGLVKDRYVVDISDLLEGQTPQLILEDFITRYEEIKPSLEKALSDRADIPISDVRIRQPVPKPGLFICGIGGFGEGEERKRPLDFFLKGWTSICGDGEMVEATKRLCRPVAGSCC